MSCNIERKCFSKHITSVSLFFIKFFKIGHTVFTIPQHKTNKTKTMKLFLKFVIMFFYNFEIRKSV